MADQNDSNTGTDDPDKIVYTKTEGDKPDDKADGKADGKTNNDTDGGNDAVDYTDLKPPKDIGDTHAEKVVSIAKKNSLSKEAAQEILNYQGEYRESLIADIQKQHEELTRNWPKEVRADEEIGGAKYTESAELARRAVDKFGTQKLIDILDETGYGNHPEMVRLFARIGKAMSDDSLITGTPTKEKVPLEDLFYKKT